MIANARAAAAVQPLAMAIMCCCKMASVALAARDLACAPRRVRTAVDRSHSTILLKLGAATRAWLPRTAIVAAAVHLLPRLVMEP